MTELQRNWFKIELLLTHSCVVLRKLFKDRWFLFTGQQWYDTTIDGEAYISGIGKKIFKQCGNIQRLMLQSGDTNRWDLTTLVLILRETQPTRKLKKVDKKKITTENNDLSKLAIIRNNNAHHPSKCISEADFETIWSQLSSMLMSFGDDADEIAELKLNMNEMKQKEPNNNENTNEAKRLKDLGNEAFNQNHFDDALKWFSQALVLAGLSDYDRSVLYSNRAATYLATNETAEVNSVTDTRYLALQDAEHARELRQMWPKAHYRVAQAYFALGEFDRAVHSYNKALALDPTNTEIKNSRDSAIERKHYYDRQDHLNIRHAPRTTREQLNKLSKATGYSNEEYEKFIEIVRKHDPGIDAVFTAHQYRDGDEKVKQNYELAARFYAKAVTLGNAEGMYNLALLHEQGLGVQKSIPTCIKLLKQAASQSPVISDKCPVPNVGVAEAEHSLGLHYETGVGVEMDCVEASRWYQRASDHGNAEAANNLGLMYGDGKGVPKDLVKSEQLLRLSAIRGDPNAAMNLALHLFANKDFQNAERWCQRASESKNMVAMEYLKKYQDAAETEREHFKELQVEKWEKKNGLTASNLTYYERIRRKMIEDNPRAEHEISILENYSETFQSLKPASPTKIEKATPYDPEILLQSSLNGSIFAQGLLEAQRHFVKAMMILNYNTVMTSDDDAQFVKELSTSIRIEHIVISMPDVLRNKAKAVVDRVLIRCNSKQSELDENARVCYGYLHGNSLEFTIEFLTVCIQLYPKSHFFLELRGSLYCFLKKFDQGLTDCNAALQLVPDDVTLLYDRAAMLRLRKHIDYDETITAYKRFLKYSPIDHRKVPEAYYAMASCFFINSNVENNFQLCQEYYEKGIEAEKLQLPCFLPYESNSKLLVSNAISTCQKLSEKMPQAKAIIDNKKSKSRLTDPRRIAMIYSHRKFNSISRNILLSENIMTNTVKPPLHQRSPATLIGLKGITLQEMNPLNDHIYDGYVLTVMIFEQATNVQPSIHLLIEDDNGDLERLFIYNIPLSEALQSIKSIYTYGTKISILNPYMRIAADGKPGIRIDEASSIIFHADIQNVTNMCRCCGEANALRVCGKCRSAHYCSKECQTIDWKELGHKLICNSIV